jgi:hypothetical protein
LEDRLRALERRLTRQGEELAVFEKGDTINDDSRLLEVRRELSDLKKAMQITPATPSRAAPVIVGDISKSGLPREIEKAISERLKGNISEDQLFEGLGFRT